MECSQEILVSRTHRTNVTEMVGDRLWFHSFGTLCAFLSTVILHRNICRCKRGKRRFCCYKCNSAWNCNSKLLVCNKVGIFAIKLQCFLQEASQVGRMVFYRITSLTLPAIALALPQAAILSRVMRSALIETLGEDYIHCSR